MKKERILFEFKLQSFSDIITNSSSELFVFVNDSKETLEDLIKAVYPNYRDEYEDLVSIEELDLESFEDYLLRGTYYVSTAKELAKKYNYKPEDFYSNWDEISKSNPSFIFPSIKEELLEDLKSQIPNTWFLYSYEDNPDWDMQEALWTIGDRIHLG